MNKRNLLALGLVCFILLVPSNIPVVHGTDSTPTPTKKPIISASNAAQLAQVEVIGRGSINHLAWSPDSKSLAVSTTTGIWLYAADQFDKPPRRIIDDAADLVVFSPDGLTLAYVTYIYTQNPAESPIVLWDLAAGRKRSTLTGGHKGFVKGVAFSPDGRMLASTAYRYHPEAISDTTLLLWDTVTGAQRAVFPDGGALPGLRFSADGQSLIYAAPYEGFSRLNWRTGSITAYPLPNSQIPYRALFTAVHPDKNMIAIAGCPFCNFYGGLWNAATGNLITPLFPEDGTNPTSMDFSPDGNQLAIGDWSGSVLLCDTTTGDQRNVLRVMNNIGSPITNVSFSSNGKLLIASNSTGFEVWETTSWKSKFISNHVAVWPSYSDGKLIYGYANGGYLDLFDAATGKRVRHIPGTIYQQPQMSPDGLLAVADHAKNIVLWDAKTGALRWLVDKAPDGNAATQFSPDSKYFFTSSPASKSVKMWNIASSTLHKQFDHTMPVVDMRISPDGLWLATITCPDYFKRLGMEPLHSTVTIWNVVTGQAYAKLDDTNYARVMFSADKKSIVLESAWQDAQHKDTLSLRDIALEKERISFNERILFWRFGSDGGLLVVVHRDRIILWDTVAGLEKNNAAIPTLKEMITISPDNSLIVDVNNGYTEFSVRLFSTQTGQLLRVLRGHRATIRSIMFSPDGTELVTSSDDGTLRRWQVTAQEEF